MDPLGQKRSVKESIKMLDCQAVSLLPFLSHSNDDKDVGDIVMLMTLCSVTITLTPISLYPSFHPDPNLLLTSILSQS